MAYFWPLIMTIIANAGYHLSARSVSSKVDPLFSVVVTYAVALIGSIILFLLSHHHTIITNVKQLNIASVTMGLAIIFIEFGYILCYKAGWSAGTTAVTVNMTMTIILIPIVILVFHQGFTVRNAIGVLLAIVSLVLMNS